MANEFHVGDSVYFIESKWRIREVKVVRLSAGLAQVRFLEGEGGIRIPASRLYKTKEEASACIKDQRSPLL